MIFRAFLSDTEAAAIRRDCTAAGVSPTVVTEVLAAAEEARCLDEMLRLFRRGMVTPYLTGGNLRWALSDAAKVELAEKVAAAVVREVMP